MSDVFNSPYAHFLEEMVKEVVDRQPLTICVCTLNPDGTILTGYYGDCGEWSKARIADAIYKESVLDFCSANARRILEAAEEDPDEE